MSNRQDDALPELPEPAITPPFSQNSWPFAPHWSADQMRAYAQSAIASLQARLDAAEADAARYRHIRKHSYVEVRCDLPRDPDWQPWQLDAVVDAVRMGLAGSIKRNA